MAVYCNMTTLHVNEYDNYTKPFFFSRTNNLMIKMVRRPIYPIFPNAMSLLFYYEPLDKDKALISTIHAYENEAVDFANKTNEAYLNMLAELKAVDPSIFKSQPDMHIINLVKDNISFIDTYCVLYSC